MISKPGLIDHLNNILNCSKLPSRDTCREILQLLNDQHQQILFLYEEVGKLEEYCDMLEAKYT